MILAIQKPLPFNADFGIVENGSVKLFNVLGQFLRETPLDISTISRQKAYKAISVLSSNGVYEVGFFGENLTKKAGSLQTVEKLMTQRVEGYGYQKRLTLKGQSNNLNYQQVIFVYPTTVDILKADI